ncbi:putative molybdenum carrier protein [Burkholderia vietnamiensis]|nr:putative molybdenum carrier protein [Burkholderia vietnamiensis]
MLRVLETASESYVQRTRFNASQTDATIAFAINPNTPGERLTRREAGASRYLHVQLDLQRDPVEVARAIHAHIGERLRASSVNVAGHSVHTLARYGIAQADLDAWIYAVFRSVAAAYPIGSIRTGGQTGVDMAGAVAGVALGIDVTVVMPRQFIQRGADGIDRPHTQGDIREHIEQQVQALSSLPWASDNTIRQDDAWKCSRNHASPRRSGLADPDGP